MMVSRISLAAMLAVAVLTSSCSKETRAAPTPPGTPLAEAPAIPPTASRFPDPCALATAAEVGAILKRKLVSSPSGSTCEFGNAPNALDIAAMTDVKLELARDDMTEAQIKGIYAQTGKAVRKSLDPDSKGLQKTIAVANDIPNLGDWAFATNVVAVNMGFGFSSRGRILHARKGPWHLTVGATISPDPGEAALDAELAGIARTAIARLP
jgi:hypothetical protein